MAFSDDIYRVACFIDQERRLYKKRKTHHFPKEMVKFGIFIFYKFEGMDGKPEDMDSDSAMEWLDAEEVIKWKRNNKNEGEYYFEILPKFEEFFKKEQSTREANIDNLSYHNLLKLYEVSLDIKDQLELSYSDQVKIWSLPPTLRFPELMPTTNDDVKIHYFEGRVESIKFLHQLSIIEEIELPECERLDEDYRKLNNQSKIGLSLDRSRFLEAFDKIERRYYKLKTISNDVINEENKDPEKVAKERLVKLVKLIQSKRVIGSDDCIELYWDDKNVKNIEGIEELIEGLESKGLVNVIDVGHDRHQEPYGRDEEEFIYFGNCIGLSVKSDKFDNFIEEFLDKKLENSEPTKKEIIDDKSQPVYRITYQKQGCKILLNNFLLAKPNFNSENELVFNYLCENPNRTIPISELEEKCLGLNSHFKKPLKSIVQGLGFQGDTKKVFFNVSEKAIYFKNPIYRKDLDELGIKELNLVRNSSK